MVACTFPFVFRCSESIFIMFHNVFLCRIIYIQCLFTFNIYLHLQCLHLFTTIYLHSTFTVLLEPSDSWLFYQLKKLAINSLCIAFLNHPYFLLELHFHPPSSFSLSCIWDTEKAMAPHSSTLAWKIPWTEEPGRLQSMGLLRVGHDWATLLSLFTFLHWRRKWQPTPVFLLGESQGWGSLVGCRL